MVMALETVQDGEAAEKGKGEPAVSLVAPESSPASFPTQAGQVTLEHWPLSVTTVSDFSETPRQKCMFSLRSLGM